MAEYPSLKSWQHRKTNDNDNDSLLGMATGAYGDAGDTERERWFTRAACAEAADRRGRGRDAVGARRAAAVARPRATGIVSPQGPAAAHAEVPRGARGSRRRSQRSRRRTHDDLEAVNEAFMCASRFDHEAVALLLLERSIALDPAARQTHRREAWTASAFVKACEKFDLAQVARARPVEGVRHRAGQPYGPRSRSGGVRRRAAARVMAARRRVGPVSRAGSSRCWRFSGTARSSSRRFSTSIRRSCGSGRRRRRERSIGRSCTRTRTLLPLLTRIWPVPDDLAFAAGMGDLARVKQWFDAAGAPAQPRRSISLQRPRRTQPTCAGTRLRRSRCSTRRSRCAVINRHLDVADFLLEHGADINTDWSTHEPASLLHAAGLHAEQLRVDAIPHRPRHRHDDQRLPMERHGTGLGVPRPAGREDGAVASGAEREQQTDDASASRYCIVLTPLAPPISSTSAGRLAKIPTVTTPAI